VHYLTRAIVLFNRREKVKYVNWTILSMSLLLSLTIIGCCHKPRNHYVSCNVEQTATGATYSCPNGSTATITNGNNVLVNTQSFLTSDDCPNGGNITKFYNDTNNNNIFDPLDDLVLSESVTCNGTNGTNGQDGAVGATGPTGLQGTAGSSVSFTVTPSTIAECASGGSDVTIFGELTSITTSVCNGVNGSNGTNGSNGVDLTPVTIVQFCPGTFSYPSTFPEIGLCIGNKMYGVYSANDGFMAYLPPGGYNSNGINSSCSFTILPNCGVQ
jgi:hypothetical protein